MDIKNLKITQKGRRLLSTVAVVLTISPFLNAHAYALDKDVSVNTNTTISENKDEVLKTTTYLVEFNETRRFNDELSAKSKKNAYEIKQKAIKDEVVKNGGFYNYSVNINKIYGSEVSTTYKVDCNNLSDLENQIKILKNNFSNSEITGITSSEIRGKVDLGTVVLDNNYKTYNDAKSAIDLKVLEYNKINANLKNYWIDKVFVKTNENNLTISLEGKTEEEIASIIKSYEDLNSDNVKVIVKRNTKEVETGKYKDELVTEKFTTYEDALLKLEEYRNNGYTVDENIKKERNTSLDEVITTTLDGVYSSYEDASSVLQGMIVDNDDYSITGNIRSEIDSDAQVVVNREFDTKEEIDNLINSYISDNYKVSNCEIIETDTKYILSATFDKEVYYVDTTRINKGYDYVVSAIKKVPLYESTHELDVNILEDIYKYVGYASFEKDNVVGYNVKFTYKNIFYEVRTTGSGSFKLIKIDSKNKSPRTSDDNDLRGYVLLASTALLGTLSSVEGLRVVKNKELCLKKNKNKY